MGNRTAFAVVVCPSRAAQSPESRHQRVRHRQPHNAVTSPTGGHRAPFPPGRFTAAAPMSAGPASTTHEKHYRCDRRKGKADDKKWHDDPSPLAPTTVIDGIVMRHCTDHELTLLLPIPSRQLRLKVLPLSTGLSDGS